MNALVKSRLHHLDQAINDLVSSVGAYNPSPAAAVAVIEADNALDDGLLQLSQHQRNFQLLQRLRTTTESLDTRIKTTLSSLAELRSELINSTPLSISLKQEPTNSVDADELLKFAQRIARPSRLTAKPGAETKSEELTDSSEAVIKRELSAPPGTGEVEDQPKTGATGLEQPTGGSVPRSIPTSQGKAVDSLRTDYEQWLEQESRRSMDLPWADQGLMRKSALNSLQDADQESEV